MEGEGAVAASQECDQEWWRIGNTEIHYQEENSKRGGTKAHERYSKYCVASTVQAARDLGATTADLRADWDSGFLVLVNPPVDKQADVGMEEESTLRTGMTPEAKRSRLEEMKVKLEKSPPQIAAARRLDFSQVGPAAAASAAGGATSPMPVPAAAHGSPRGPQDSPEENSRPCGNCQLPGCRFCGCLVCKNGRCERCQVPSADPDGGNPILAAIQQLTATVESMRLSSVNKADLAELRSDLKREVKVAVAEAVDPVKDEVSDLKTRVSALEARPTTAGSNGGSSSLPKEVQTMLSNLDPATRRVAFVGFPGGMSAQDRLAEVARIMRNFPSIKFSDHGNFMKGPRSNRSMTPASYVEFASSDARDDALKAMGSSANLSTGERLKVKAAITKLNSHRNWALRAAKEVLEKSSLCTGRNIELDMKSRVVKVGGEVAFQQAPNETAGNFTPKFSSLKLP